MPKKKTKELNNHLILHGWLNYQFGYKTTRELLSDVSGVDEGFNPNGYSPICEFLMSRSDLKNEIEDALPIYDANIKRQYQNVTCLPQTTTEHSQSFSVIFNTWHCFIPKFS